MAGKLDPPDYTAELQVAGDSGLIGVAGVDEVGRGAWAGPVVVGAAVTDGSDPPDGLTDSKRIPARRRADMAARVRDWAVDHAVGRAEAAEVDDLGMTAALRLAARRALQALDAVPEAVVLDGGHDYLGAPWRVHTRVRADCRCVSVAAASIVAKVHRDALMADMDARYPGYGFATAVGYPSPVHRRALEEHGPTEQHRLSWAYMDRLPRWRHLRRPPGGTAAQSALF